jgi:type IV pilus assembly protein PilO
MALLPQDQKNQVMLLVTILAGVGGYAFWKYYYVPTSAQIEADKTQVDSLQTALVKVKEDLANGTVDDLRAKVDGYRGMLITMRRLVPDGNEVPTLIDDISTKAKERGVTINEIDPMPVDPGQPFDTYRYKLEILGHYDELGEYLSDIASLPRIVVPEDLFLKPASNASQRMLSDTVGALLEADFNIRTFVKSTTPAPASKASGHGGHAAAGGHS